MSGTLEKQYVVSRAAYTPGGAVISMRPWKWFDSRAEARRFVKAKASSSRKWEYAIHPVTRGPRA